MTFAEFINKHAKTKVDYDKRYGPQCVDLFRQYCADVLNIGHTGGVDGAKDLWLRYSQLPKEQENFMQVAGNFKCGDVMVWDGTATNRYGHVALVVSVLDGGKVLVFEQNGIKQDGAKFAVKDATNALGVLRPKNR